MTVPTPEPAEQDDVYSPRTVRITLAAVAVALALVAILVTSGWLDWLLFAVAVILGCAAITPPFRRPTQ